MDVNLSELSANETEILRNAGWIRERPQNGVFWTDGYTGWFTPYAVGGANRSHHSYTLKKLIGKGLIETTKRESLSNIRGSRIYRITTAGARLLEKAKKITNPDEESLKFQRN